MHQCDYCCWYYAPRGCECPYPMKDQACAKAAKLKEENEKVISKIH